MPLTSCFACRAPVTETDIVCPACGDDLDAIRAEMATLMAPPAGAVVLPLATMRKLSPRTRRAVAQAIDAVRAARRPS